MYIIILTSGKEERKSYRFKMAWGWVKLCSILCLAIDCKKINKSDCCYFFKNVGLLIQVFKKEHTEMISTLLLRLEDSEFPLQNLTSC